jgi:spermidine synthase
MVNLAPDIYGGISLPLVKYGLAAVWLYMSIVTPFVFAGLAFSYLFSAFPSRINALYFWDLLGAAVGCVIFLPFIRDLGPGGLMIASSGALVLISALLLGKKSQSIVLVTIGVIVFATPFIKTAEYFDFDMLQDKRGLRTALEEGRVERSVWDPISKIDVVTNRFNKHIAYDGGSQSSNIFSFDGDYEGLRESILQGGDVKSQFWHHGVLASHYFRRDSNAEVLIIGSAGGQETKEAMMFNPKSVDGIELVGTVVELGKTHYADYNGGIFLDPRVNNRVGEGRAFLRSSSTKYDIIQIFSNHTSSNIATGMGATTPIYLQTAEAYGEYFSQLKDDGVLHINHHFYPRMVTTAALGWAQIGRTNFQDHVVIFERQNIVDTLPTMLIKMSPWTQEELDDVATIIEAGNRDSNQDKPWKMVVNPLDPTGSFLWPQFFDPELPESLQKVVGYNVWPPTDDQPFFSTILKSRQPVQVDDARYINRSMVSAINGRAQMFAGEYTIFVVVGIAGLLCSLAVVLIPLYLSPVGRTDWAQRKLWITYFSCLGAGFIIIELILIQLFMKPIGFPLYTFAVVLFVLLLSAAAGSLLAKSLNVKPGGAWGLPFKGILISGLLFATIYPTLFEVLLSMPLWARILGAAISISPLGFFLGMPFPLGIWSLSEQPRGAIAWAWGMNALFTVVGGIACGWLSLEIGFRNTLFIGLAIYVGAYFLAWRLVSVDPERLIDEPPWHSKISAKA